MYELSQELLRIAETGEGGTLVVVTSVDGHGPQVVGAKMIVKADGSLVGTVGGGKFEHVVIQRAHGVRESGRPCTVSLNLKAELGMCCGGRMEVYMEPIVGRERLILFGAGHVAQPTAALAAQCGFDVVVIDEREEWNTDERFPTAKETVVAPHGDFLANGRFASNDYIIICTHNHDHDQAILSRVLRESSRYVGMIGSSQKVKTAYKRLRLEGHGDQDIARVHAPIGLDILAETPDEIAVAIVGELIRCRHQPTSSKKTRGAAIASLRDEQGEEL